MPIPIPYTRQGLVPARSPQLATQAPYALPCGGPVGVGGAYAQGQAIGLIGGAVANHVFTLTITLGGATGYKGYFAYYGDKVYSGLGQTGGLTANAVTTLPTAAQLQAALIIAVPLWSGNVTVTGTSPYTITFGNLMASRKVGGLLQFLVSSSTGGTPTGAITVATNGSIGAGQADIYAQATNNRVDGFLINSCTLDPVGAVPTEYGDAGQPTSGNSCWINGQFYADTTNYPEKSVVGLDANAMTLGKLSFVNGTALTDTGVIVQLN